MKARLLILAPLVLILLQGSPALATVNSCLECHADESIMKALFTPPVLDGGEGEG